MSNKVKKSPAKAIKRLERLDKIGGSTKSYQNSTKVMDQRVKALNKNNFKQAKPKIEYYKNH